MQVTPKQAESFTDTIKEAVKKTESIVLDFLIDNDLISGNALNKYTELKYGDTGYDPNVKNISPIFERALETPKRDSERISQIEMRERGSKVPDRLKMNKGGMPTQMQMAFMDDGGLKDEGGEVEPTSGNDVPSGSLKEEVKDDIPTMLSEGEFVFPADVVRYIGLEKLMVMRQEAKMGLKRMEAMGQMGDEPTIPDDLPFGMADLVVIAGGKEEEDDDDKPRKMQTGGLSEYNPQFRTLTSPQQVPVRSGRRNITLPDIKDLTNPVSEEPKVEEPTVVEPEVATEEEMTRLGLSDRGYAQSKPEDKGIAKPFKQYRGEEFDAAADSYTNLGAKVLSYTPLGMLSDIPYNSGKAVAKKALEEGKWSDEVLEMKNPFKSDLEPAVRTGAAITEWEKAALIKYLTVDRPKNSIFQSVSNLIGKAFGKEVKEDKKTKGPDEDILKFLKDKKLITIDPSTNKISVMLEGKAVLLENVDKWMDTWKEKNKPAPPTSTEQNAIRQFDTVGFVSNFGADSNGEGGLNLQYMGDVGGTGASRMDIFRIDDGTGQGVKFVRRYELENAGVDTSDTLAVLNALKGFKDTGQIKANPIVTNSVSAKETPPLDYTDPTDPNNLYVEDRSDPPTDAVTPADIRGPEELLPQSATDTTNLLYGNRFDPSDMGVDPRFTDEFGQPILPEYDQARQSATEEFITGRNPLRTVKGYDVPTKEAYDEYQTNMAYGLGNQPVTPDLNLWNDNRPLPLNQMADVPKIESPTSGIPNQGLTDDMVGGLDSLFGEDTTLPDPKDLMYNPKIIQHLNYQSTRPTTDYENPYEGTMLDPSASVQNYLDLAKKEGVDIGADDLGLSQLPKVDLAAEEKRIKAEIAERKRRAAEAARLEAQAKALKAKQDEYTGPVTIPKPVKSLSAADFAKKEARKKKATTGYMGGRAKGGLAKMKVKPTKKRKGGLASKKK